jgi:hypothetical protein
LEGRRPGRVEIEDLALEEDATMAMRLKPMHPDEVLRESV